MYQNGGTLDNFATKCGAKLGDESPSPGRPPPPTTRSPWRHERAARKVDLNLRSNQNNQAHTRPKLAKSCKDLKKWLFVGSINFLNLYNVVWTCLERVETSLKAPRRVTRQRAASCRGLAWRKSITYCRAALCSLLYHSLILLQINFSAASANNNDTCK